MKNFKNTKRQSAKNSKNKLVNKNGITLIALVITIIVLLILAGVTINAIVGNDSSMEKAQQAKTQNEQADELDTIKLAVVDAVAIGDNGQVSLANLKTALLKIPDVVSTIQTNALSGDGPWIITGKTGIKYKITTAGTVTAAEKVATVAFDNTEDTIAVGKSKKLAITARGASGGITEANEVTFTSKNTSVATVQEDGSIKIADNATVGAKVKITVVADEVEGLNECEVTVVSVPKIGDYIEYDVEYNTNSRINGWRILDIPEETNNEGKYEGVKIISRQFPVSKGYGSNVGNAATTLLNDFESISFQKYVQFYTNDYYTYLKIDGIEYTGTITGAILKTNAASEIHNLTLQELNNAINKINGKALGDDGYREPETCMENVSNDLFDLGGLTYWLSNLDPNNSSKLLRIAGYGEIDGNNSNINGLRPVITLKPVTLTWNSTGSYWEVQ